MIRKILMMVLMIVSTVIYATADTYTPRKREFRGAWIQCVNGQFIGMSTQKMQQTLSYQLDELQKDGVNAIFFQVRAVEPIPHRQAGAGSFALLGSSAVDD